MLSGKGFKKVFNVSGGIKAWKSKIAIGTQTLGMNLFDGHEEPLDVLKVAYSLEQGLRVFYLDMGSKAENNKVKELFAKLSEIETQHQQSIFNTYNDMSTSKISLDEFEKIIKKNALEGGMSTDEYLDLFKPDFNSATDIISLAMSIEAQALDLYQRVSVKVKNSTSRDIINKIANEEKAHLASLGKLMDNVLKED
jgi:sulfur-carrier protein adenylyltransferase/sulfurtransferase